MTVAKCPAIVKARNRKRMEKMDDLSFEAQIRRAKIDALSALLVELEAVRDAMQPTSVFGEGHMMGIMQAAILVERRISEATNG